MVNFEKDGLVLELDTKEMTHREFFILFQPSLDMEVLKSIIPNLRKFGISADDVEATIAPKNKTWGVLTRLVQNGLSVKSLCHWYDTDYIGPCEDLNWLFSAYLKRGISPDELARAFSGFLSRGLLNQKKNVEVLLNLGVTANTLVRDVMTREQITEHFKLLYDKKASIDLIINTVGVFPKFYEKYSVKSLHEMQADLLRVSEYIFFPTQSCTDAMKYLMDLEECHLSWTDFVCNVVVAKNINLHVIVEFAEFFSVRYVKVENVLRDVCEFKASKTPTRRNMENKLIILANFSKLAELGFIDAPKRVKKDWKWELDMIRRSIFYEVYDRHEYNCGFLLDADGFKYAEEVKPVDDAVSDSVKKIIDSEVPDFLKEPRRSRTSMLELPVDPFDKSKKTPGRYFRSPDGVPEMAPSVYER